MYYTDNLDNIQIDDSLYNRQRYVLGDDAMKKLFQTRVFLYGLNGLGAEIAKDLVLAGVKELVICDESLVTISDIGTQFFLRESDVGMNRALCTCPRLSELNPSVSVSVFGGLIVDELSILEEFTCVIFVNCLSLSLLELANQHCREAKVAFIAACIFGVFASIFNDFGDTFEILDRNGEEKREFIIEYVSRDERGVVRVFGCHDLEPGDRVTFHNVRGMVELNNGEYDVIEVTSRNVFRIGDTSAFSDYELDSSCVGCGVKRKPTNVSFESLSTQLHNPKFISDMGKPTALRQNHLAYITMLQFVAKEGRTPQAYNQSDFELMVQMTEDMPCLSDGKPDYDVIRDMANTCSGCLQPLCATLGGIVAQEALIALTNTFTPIQQWLHFDAREVIPRYGVTPEEFATRGDRYDSLRICIGETNLQRLVDVNSFMVGCGAIGCEVLKNIALMGVSRKGKFTVTDNDVIERTNLTNQLLFRERDIKQPKSTTARKSAVELNPQVNIEAHQNKTGNRDHYTDQFIQNQDFVINAVDNIDTRLYTDRRCIDNHRPLLESGVMGAKGHVQVIIPFQTETYSSTYSEVEPVDCSLPLKKTHCVDRAWRKFNSVFMEKPRMYSDFWSTTDALELLTRMQQGEIPEHSIAAVRLLANGVYSFEDCVRVARIKFDNYFKHIPNFTHRRTYLICFNSSKFHHIQFVTSCAKLLAFRSGIQVTGEECKIENVLLLLENFKVTTHIKKRRNESETFQRTMDYLVRVTNSKMSLPITNYCFTMQTNAFNADDVTHIDFITAGSNLVAENYSTSPLDRWYVKKRVGMIIPAIVTTSSVVSGLVTIELIKLVEKCLVEQHTNCSISLAVPILQFSEPGPVGKIELRPGEFFTAWDRWEINGNDDMTLGQFIIEVNKEYNVDLCLIAQGTKLFYISYIPSHTARLNGLMSHIIEMTDTESYVDLVASSDECEDIPNIRYYWA